MILIDCIFINSGGGKVLLDFLVSKVNETNQNVVFVFDDRLLNAYVNEKFVNRPLFVKASLRKRRDFYRLNGNKFGSVLTLANIPPPIKLNVPVFTYFQNVLYLEKKKYLKLSKFLLIFLKIMYLKIKSKNTDYWIVQTNSVKAKLIDRFKLKKELVFIIPFYPDDFSTSNYDNFIENRKAQFKLIYLYVSNGEKYKNHLNLFKAFEKFSTNKNNIELIVTISENYKSLISQIRRIKNKGVQINNIGLVERIDLNRIYYSANFILFPSFFESFGLGLIEAAQLRLPIIASDLDYVREIIIPSKVFDPENIDSIVLALEDSYYNILNASELKIKNEITKLFELIFRDPRLS